MNLTRADLLALEKSYITPELALAAGLARVTSAEGAALVGRNGSGDYAGISFPNIWPGDPAPREFMLRVDHPELEAKADGTFREKTKYLAPPGRANLLYVPPGVTAGMLAEVSLPIIICEGAKKALALWRLATSEIGRPRFLPVAISGVWNWRGTVGREPGPDGVRRAVKGPIPDLARIPWQERSAYIVFDSDKHRNESVRAAERNLALELKSRGARMLIVDLRDLPGLDKTGADDFLAHPDGGPEALLHLIAGAKEFSPDLIGLMHNDYGNARRIASLYGDDLRYCHKLRKWLVWDGHRWAVDEEGLAEKHAKLAMLEFLRQAVEAKNEGAEGFARASLNQRMLRSALESAQTELTVAVE
ncbi:MAG: DUF3854 domain-containing protein [Acidobacteriia bacterium]|nr:DUF3854 domain-containing protein [Terriglobia bacterium]